MVASTPVSLIGSYDLVVLDLDGVVYIGGNAVPGAVEALTAVRAAGLHLAYVTNNAARPPHDVADQLTRLGVPADAGDVVTSAQAAARLVAEQVPAGSAVFVIGGDGLEQALRELDLVPVTDLDGEAVAVVQGYGPQMPWRQVIDGAILVRQGLPWVASNLDLTVPTRHGPGPGNGTLVRLVADYAGRQPVVAGKPEPPLLRETLTRVGGELPLMVGDRLDTDIDGARAVGWDSLLVMTGVTALPDLADLAAEHRPTYLTGDLSGLLDEPGTTGEWQVQVVDDVPRVSGSGSLNEWWVAVSAALWAHLDDTGRPADVAGLVPGSVGP